MSLLFVLGPLFSGCGIFYPPTRDGDGYYTKHFYCCGPTAVRAALGEYHARNGIVNVRAITTEEISKQIQDNGKYFRKFLSFFNRDVVCVTWTWEMKAVMKKWGFELINIDDFEKLDPKKDIAFILVRGRFFSSEWHWMCYPVDNKVKTWFGSGTKIDKILLLKKIN